MGIVEWNYEKLEKLAEEYDRIQEAKRAMQLSGMVAIGVVPFAALVAGRLFTRFRGILNPMLVVTSLVSVVVAARLSQVKEVKAEVPPPGGPITEVARLGGSRVNLLDVTEVNLELGRLSWEYHQTNQWLECRRSKSCLFLLLPAALLFCASVALWKEGRGGYSSLAQASAASLALWHHWLWRTDGVRQLQQRDLATAYHHLMLGAVNTNLSDQLALQGLLEVHLDKLTEEGVDILKRCAPNLQKIVLYTNPSDAVHRLSARWKAEGGIRFIKGWD